MQHNYFDPKDKNSEADDQPLQHQENEEGVYLVNNSINKKILLEAKEPII